MEAQTARAVAFRELHEAADAFVIPNPWDAGSAKILARLGFKALATTSSGLAASLGVRDGGLALVTREETLANAAAIAAATELPVSTDLENCYAETPDGVGETIRLAAAAGVVGGSIEDASGNVSQPIYPLDVAVERVKAAVAAAGELPFPFTLTARSENFLHGITDLDDTIARLRAFEAAGADVLYCPGITDIDQVRAVCSAVDKPVNVLPLNPAWTVEQLAEAGAKRISLGSALSSAAYGAALSGAREVAEKGSFGFTADPAAREAGAMMDTER
ncbi:isocitrate lyase/PEP mutase family protein [Stackebrandtia nassauensis]|uniref:isocitrate lyase/PEP mutase family protein n=1 Tax=Stackebrandtia nassauensis TaxID=283811 RepID=UPI00118710D8